MPNMVTVRQAVFRLKTDGMPISEYTLRKWIRTGEIPYRMAGSKALIFYPNLVAYIKGDSTASSPIHREGM